MRPEKRLWWVSATANFLLGGKWPETLCSRSFRLRHKRWYKFWFNLWNAVWRDDTHCVISHLHYVRKTKGGESNLGTQELD